MLGRAGGLIASSSPKKSMDGCGCRRAGGWLETDTRCEAERSSLALSWTTASGCIKLDWELSVSIRLSDVQYHHRFLVLRGLALVRPSPIAWIHIWCE